MQTFQYISYKNPTLKNFDNNVSGFSVPAESTIRNHQIQLKLKEEIINDIKDSVVDKSILLMIDESPDKRGKYDCNIMVSVLEEHKSNALRLYKVCSLTTPLNGDILTGIITRTLTSLFGFELTKNLVIIVTDNGSYNNKTVEGLKLQNDDMNIEFVTCIIHMINRILDKAQSKTPLVYKFIKKLNQIIKNSRMKRKL